MEERQGQIMPFRVRGETNKGVKATRPQRKGTEFKLYFPAFRCHEKLCKDSNAYSSVVKEQAPMITK